MISLFCGADLENSGGLLCKNYTFYRDKESKYVICAACKKQIKLSNIHYLLGVHVIQKDIAIIEI